MIVVRLDTTRLDELTAEMEPRAEKVIEGAAYAVEGRAKTMAPVDTGALRNSINAESAGRLTWRVSDGVLYGIYLELGYHHFGSGAFIQIPFMVPAVEQVRPEFERMWGGLFV